MKLYTLRVIDLHQETSDTITVIFKQPGLKRINYIAGQYLTLIFNINGRRYIRPYSFSSAPGIDSTLNITVKRVPGGIVSNHIIDKLKINDIVEVMEPMGKFILQEDNTRSETHIVLWGAGSGITPLISIAKHALYQNLVKHVTLVYGNRSFESVIFNDKISELEEQYSGAFSAWHFHTTLAVDENNPYLIQGRIDPNIVMPVVVAEGEVKNTVHFICGPVGLKESVKAVLAELNVPNEQIYTEDFEVVRNPSDFEDITTQFVVIHKNNTNQVLEVIRGKSILEAALDANIDLSYSCQTGSCLVCRARLLKGNIKTIGIEKMPEDLNSDERLLCCSFPLTKDVEVVIA
jgi:ring-1,2-phenylacetyl-CoA epoxidase subunit PaaE